MRIHCLVCLLVIVIIEKSVFCLQKLDNIQDANNTYLKVKQFVLLDKNYVPLQEEFGSIRAQLYK